MRTTAGFKRDAVLLAVWVPVDRDRSGDLERRHRPRTEEYYVLCGGFTATERCDARRLLLSFDVSRGSDRRDHEYGLKC
jgi:hypothetical protein